MEPLKSPLIHANKAYHYGKNSIIDKNDHYKTGMNFTVLRLHPNQEYEVMLGMESAYLLMSGEVDFEFDGEQYCAFRTSYFDENPIVLHLSAYDTATIKARTECELLVMETDNSQRFLPMIFDEKNMLESERRGQGLLNDVSYRIVRTVFDKRNRPDSNLVVGEIITFSGHWSSCPPHTHPQPEVYYYRFSEPQGFGIGENGDNILRIRHNDTLVILDNKEHAHSCAPGYALYTLWFIKHLEDNPYLQPTFKKEHAWAKNKAANLRVWQPREDI